MDNRLIEKFVERMRSKKLSQADADTNKDLKPGSVKKVRARPYAYSERHRGNWFRPEYDFDEINIAQDVSSFLLMALKKKGDRLFLAGFEFVSENEDALEYIQRRVAEFEMATEKPFAFLIDDTAADLFRFNNAMWVKTRDKTRSSGRVRTDIRGLELEPVAGYHILPFETLRFKTRSNGEIKKVMQVMPDGTKKEFFPWDLVHFHINRKPGFTVGTPSLLPALDDIALLRRIEENVEELIETNLFPVFHYKVGNDMFPERFSPDGIKESDIVKKTIEYMPSGGVYVSDHRHEIEAIGSESKALRIDFYLNYFKMRVFAALGVSAVDMGEGGTANRSTASTMSKNLMMEVEALQARLKVFLEFYVINELLMEGGYNPLDPQQKVHVKFGVIDKEERMALENQQIQLFTNKLVKQTESRKALGLRPLTEEDQDDMYYKRYEEPLAMVKSMSPGSAAGETLVDVPTSNVERKAVNQEKTFAKQMEKQKKAGQQGRPSSGSSGQRKASASKSRPSNQSGTRTGPKLNRDVTLSVNDESVIISVDSSISDTQLEEWSNVVYQRFANLAGHGISFVTVVENQLPKLRS